MKKGYKRVIPYIFLPLGVLLFYLGALNHDAVEKVYSNGVFKIIIAVISSITGIIPFSLSGFIIVLAVLFVLWAVVKTAVKLFRKANAGHRKEILFKFLSRAMIITGIVYFSFVAVWGLNYQRLPFAEISGLDVKPSSVDELAKACEYIIEKTNSLRDMVDEGSSRTMTVPGGYMEVLNRAAIGYENLSKTYPELSGSYGKPKAFFLSLFMSYSGISGMYFPFTGEANVNVDVPMSILPSTVCHEMAHQRGFAREDEANFIGYLACKAHPDADFQYSGYLLALTYSMNTLYYYDIERYNELRKQYSPGVVRDLQENYLFWQQYEGLVQEISEKMNDAYLKANMQDDGIHSYGRMVDLLIAEYRKLKL